MTVQVPARQIVPILSTIPYRLIIGAHKPFVESRDGTRTVQVGTVRCPVEQWLVSDWFPDRRAEDARPHISISSERDEPDNRGECQDGEIGFPLLHQSASVSLDSDSHCPTVALHSTIAPHTEQIVQV